VQSRRTLRFVFTFTLTLCSCSSRHAGVVLPLLLPLSIGLAFVLVLALSFVIVMTHSFVFVMTLSFMLVLALPFMFLLALSFVLVLALPFMFVFAPALGLSFFFAALPFLLVVTCCCPLVLWAWLPRACLSPTVVRACTTSWKSGTRVVSWRCRWRFSGGCSGCVLRRLVFIRGTFEEVSTRGGRVPRIPLGS